MDCANCSRNTICDQLIPDVGCVCDVGHTECQTCKKLDGARAKTAPREDLKNNLVPQKQTHRCLDSMFDGFSECSVSTVKSLSKLTLSLDATGGDASDECSCELYHTPAVSNLTENLVFPKHPGTHKMVKQTKTQHMLRAAELEPKQIGPLKNEFMKHYLYTHGPLARPTSPQVHSVSVSNDSTPSLNSFQPAATPRDLALQCKFGNQKYVTCGINERHQIPKTYQEDTSIPKLIADSKPETETDTSHSENLKGEQKDIVCPDVVNDRAISFAPKSYVYRAVIKSITNQEQIDQNTHHLPQLNAVVDDRVIQCEKIFWPLAEHPNLKSRNTDPPQSIQEAFRLLSPVPFHCPEDSCSIMLFVADFNRHFHLYHNSIPRENIIVNQCVNVVVNPKLKYNGLNICHIVYYLHEKLCVQSLNPPEYFLPLVVMSSHVSIEQTCGKPPETFFMLWVTGFAPKNRPIYITITMWPRTCKTSKCNLAYSGEIYSIRKSQSPLKVLQSGQMLIVSENEISRLSNKHSDLLNVQMLAEIGVKPKE